MTSCTHQMISQVSLRGGNHSRAISVVFEAPKTGESNKDFVNDGKWDLPHQILCSLLALPVECSKQKVDNKNKNLQKTGVLGDPYWLFGVSAWGTEPNSSQQVWYAGIQ